MKRRTPRQAVAPVLLATLCLVLLSAACGPPREIRLRGGLRLR